MRQKQAAYRRPPDPTRHGHTAKGRHSPTYSSWCHMINRCTNPRNDSYEYYGGRGITVCRRWRTFENFLADMGERPPGLTIERKNNNKGYFPSNCGWATRREQIANRRRARKAEPLGERHHSAKLNAEKVRQIRARASENQHVLAAEFGVSQASIWAVLHRKTWAHV